MWGSGNHTIGKEAHDVISTVILYVGKLNLNLKKKRRRKKRQKRRGEQRGEESVAFTVYYELGSVLSSYTHELIYTPKAYEVGTVTSLYIQGN